MKDDKSPQGKFKILKVTKFDDLVEGKELELPESDLCFQTEKSIVQLEYVKPEEDTRSSPASLRWWQAPAG